MSTDTIWVLLRKLKNGNRWHLMAPYHVYKKEHNAVRRALEMSGGRVEYKAVEYREVGQ